MAVRYRVSDKGLAKHPDELQIKDKRLDPVIPYRPSRLQLYGAATGGDNFCRPRTHY